MLIVVVGIESHVIHLTAYVPNNLYKFLRELAWSDPYKGITRGVLAQWIDYWSVCLLSKAVDIVLAHAYQ
jgi:hypothetical protein